MSSDTNHEPESDLPRSIGKTARRVLAIAGYTQLVQLTAASEAELLRLHGVGPKAIRLLREALAAQGLALARRWQSVASRRWSPATPTAEPLSDRLSPSRR